MYTVYVYVYIYIHVYVCMCVYIYVYIYIYTYILYTWTFAVGGFLGHQSPKKRDAKAKKAAYLMDLPGSGGCQAIG